MRGLKEVQIWDCPFCGKNTIQVLYFPSTARPEKTSWGGSRPWMNITKEKIIVQSGCSACGKTREEIEKEFKMK